MIPTLVLCLLLSGGPLLFGQTPADYVNTGIGTFGSGRTFIGAATPWGMVSVDPHYTQLPDGGYLFQGFGHTHISGAGCNALGHIVLMPAIDTLHPDPEAYGYRFRNWLTRPLAGYCEVYLEDERIMTEVTATPHAGFSAYTFPARDGNAYILFDVSAGYSLPRGSHVEFLSPTELRGWHISEGFCSNSSVQRTTYFYAQISKTPEEYGVWSGTTVTTATAGTGDTIGAFLRFTTDGSERIFIKVGISYVSMDNARLNLATEIPHWDFERTRQDAAGLWNEQLGKIQVAGSEERKRTFYTALYHALLHPNIYSDVNGDFPSSNGYRTTNATDYTRYTNFSLWDTFRTTHPFLSLVYPQQQRDMARTLVEHFRENGRLSQWDMPGGESNAMSGDPAGLVLLDTYRRGIRDFDIATAAAAAWNNASVHDTTATAVRRGMDAYLTYGFIPMDDRGTPWAQAPASTTLEYCYSDWAASQLALEGCRPELWTDTYTRSKNYRTLFDTTTGFFRPRMKDSTWFAPFVPEWEEDGDFPGSGGPGFAEGHAWHYRFYVLHDIDDLASLLGGPDSTVQYLDAFFYNGFFRWNEHNCANPYLFTLFDNEGHRTQKLVRTLSHSFHNSNTGIPGNDDLGALSTWYVLTAMGLYPAQPGIPEYRIGSPLFDTITIALDNRFYPGESFRIIATGNTDTTVYIGAMALNGNRHPWYSLAHNDIAAGGELALMMSDKPSSTPVVASPIPRPLTPDQGQLLEQTEVTLSWKSREGALQTHLRIVDMTAGCSVVLDTALPAATSSYVFGALRPSAHYRWSVRHSYTDYESDWSQPAVLQTATTLSVATSASAVPVSLRVQPLPASGDQPVDLVVTLASPAFVRLTIIDLLGREQAVLASERKDTGTHTLRWHPQSAAGSVFFVRLEADGTVITRPLLRTR